MSIPKTAAGRTAASAAAAASVTAYAVNYLQLGAVLATPAPFDGVWLHSTDVGPTILSDGWKPDLVKNTIYGDAIYLSRQKWGAGHSHVITCSLDLQASQVMSSFSSQWATGVEEKHVIWHLKDQGLTVGINASTGLSTQNQKIASHFSGSGIRAIAFTERGTEIVAVYDPSCIIVHP